MRLLGSHTRREISCPEVGICLRLTVVVNRGDGTGFEGFAALSFFRRSGRLLADVSSNARRVHLEVVPCDLDTTLMV